MRPEGPLLRRQLLAWLLAPLLLLLTADAFVGYWVSLRFSRGAHDRTLLEVAREFSLYVRGGGLALEIPEEAAAGITLPTFTWDLADAGIEDLGALAVEFEYIETEPDYGRLIQQQ